MSTTKITRVAAPDTPSTGDTPDTSDRSPHHEPLRGSDPSDDYAAAFEEWISSGEAAVWDAVAGDG